MQILSVFISPPKLVLHAFEMKIGIGARRFLRRTVTNIMLMLLTVLPPDEAAKAEQSLTVFQTINVGLWAFDKEENCIKKIHNPAKIAL